MGHVTQSAPRRWLWRGAIALLIVLGAIRLAIVDHLGPPPIAQGYITKETENDYQGVSRRIALLLKRQYPVGSSASRLRAELHAEGFHFFEPNEFHTQPGADYYWGIMPCERKISVDWGQDSRGRIFRISGGYYWSCL